MAKNEIHMRSGDRDWISRIRSTSWTICGFLCLYVEVVSNPKYVTCKSCLKKLAKRER